MRPPAFLPRTREQLSTVTGGRCYRCGGPGTDYAHRRGRSVRDDHTACFCNATWSCRSCHRWQEQNRVPAQEAGYVLGRYEEQPWTVPIVTIFGTLQANCDGTLTQVKP